MAIGSSRSLRVVNAVLLAKALGYKSRLVFLDCPVRLALDLEDPLGTNGALSARQFGCTQYTSKLH